MINYLLNLIFGLPVSHFTTDGHTPCPYPSMTDEDLRDYESAFNIPTSFE